MILGGARMSGKKQNVYDARFVGEDTIKRPVKNPRTARPRTEERTSMAQSVQNSQAKPPRLSKTTRPAPKAVQRPAKKSEAKTDGRPNTIDTLAGAGVKNSPRVIKRGQANTAHKQTPTPEKRANTHPQSKPKVTPKNTSKRKAVSPKGENIKKKISNQSPSARKKQKLDKKITGSATKIEVKRREHREKTTFRIKKKNNSFKTAVARTILFLVTFALISGVIFSLFALNLKSGTDNKKSSLYINVGDKNDPRKYSYYSSYCQLDSVYYICADDLLNLYSMTVTGTNEHLHYIVSESDEYVSFDVGTRNATVNGSPVKLEKACFMMGGRLYVPATFFTGYSEGLDFDVKNGEMNIERVKTVKATNGKPNYEPISFELKPVSIPAVMSEEDAKGDGVFINDDDDDNDNNDDNDDNDDRGRDED